MADKELIEALRRGSNEAWTELVDRYLKLVYHVIRETLSAYTKGSADPDVEDITNDLFQSLVRDDYRVLRTIGAPYDLKAWLAISAKRRAIDFVRKRRVSSVSLDDAREEEDLVLGQMIASKPEQNDAQQAEYQNAVREALSALSPKERLVIQLFYLKGRKYREIAKLTGINQNSISPTLMRGVEKMQKYLKERDLLSR